jgi:hypothetical protein
MKKGNWVLTDGEIGQITLLDYINNGTSRCHLVDVPSLSYASLRSEKGMTLIDKSVADILNAVKTNEENHGTI